VALGVGALCYGRKHRASTSRPAHQEGAIRAQSIFAAAPFVARPSRGGTPRARGGRAASCRRVLRGDHRTADVRAPRSPACPRSAPPHHSPHDDGHHRHAIPPLSESGTPTGRATPRPNTRHPHVAELHHPARVAVADSGAVTSGGGLPLSHEEARRGLREITVGSCARASPPQNAGRALGAWRAPCCIGRPHDRPDDRGSDAPSGRLRYQGVLASLRLPAPISCPALDRPLPVLVATSARRRAWRHSSPRWGLVQRADIVASDVRAWRPAAIGPDGARDGWRPRALLAAPRAGRRVSPASCGARRSGAFFAFLSIRGRARPGLWFVPSAPWLRVCACSAVSGAVGELTFKCSFVSRCCVCHKNRIQERRFGGTRRSFDFQFRFSRSEPSGAVLLAVVAVSGSTPARRA